MKNTKGITFVELMVYMVIFSILLGMITGVFFWLRKTGESTRRLELLHSLRSSAFQISEELSFATDIVYPASDMLNQQVFQLVFTDQKNDLITIYLDQNGQLTRINLREHEADASAGIKVLSDETVKFTVIRRKRDYVEFILNIREKPEDNDGNQSDKKVSEYVLVNSAELRNKMN